MLLSSHFLLPCHETGRQMVANRNPENRGIGAETRRLILFVQSYLVRDDKNARFYGNLDIKTLGGAGFASQRTVSEDKNWDLSEYAGIQLDIAKGDSKFNLGEFVKFGSQRLTMIIT